MAQKKEILSKEDKNSVLYSWTVDTHYGITVEEVKEINNVSASLYDDFYKKTGWEASVHGAYMLDKFLTELAIGKMCNIIDVGVGTGLVGVQLCKLGYKNLVGVDLAEQMLEEASKKGVYQQLHQLDMYSGDMSPYTQQYDAAISIGTFTAGQLKPEIMEKLATFVRPGGLVCLSVRDITWEKQESGFARQVDELEERKVWKLLDKKVISYHKELGENCYLLVLQII